MSKTTASKVRSGAKQKKMAGTKGHKAKPERDAAATASLKGQGAAPNARDVSATDGQKSGDKQMRDPRLPAPGTVLVKRDRKGNPICECLVRESDVVYKEGVFASLSAAATAAARDLGQRGAVNGYVFFQVIKPNAKAAPPAERLRRIGERYEEQLGIFLVARPATAVDDEISVALKEAIDLHIQRVQGIVALHAT